MARSGCSFLVLGVFCATVLYMKEVAAVMKTRNYPEYGGDRDSAPLLQQLSQLASTFFTSYDHVVDYLRGDAYCVEEKAHKNIQDLFQGFNENTCFKGDNITGLEALKAILSVDNRIMQQLDCDARSKCSQLLRCVVTLQDTLARLGELLRLHCTCYGYDFFGTSLKPLKSAIAQINSIPELVKERLWAALEKHKRNPDIYPYRLYAVFTSLRVYLFDNDSATSYSQAREQLDSIIDKYTQCNFGPNFEDRLFIHLQSSMSPDDSRFLKLLAETGTLRVNRILTKLFWPRTEVPEIVRFDTYEDAQFYAKVLEAANTALARSIQLQQQSHPKVHEQLFASGILNFVASCLKKAPFKYACDNDCSLKLKIEKLQAELKQKVGEPSTKENYFADGLEPDQPDDLNLLKLSPLGLKRKNPIHC